MSTYCRALSVGWWGCFMSTALLFSCRSVPDAERELQGPEDSVAVLEESTPRGTPFAILETEKGDIVVRLLPDVAPETVRAFIELAEVGFYNRTSFHRVMRDRMIQGGDPLSRDNNPYNDGLGTSGSYLLQEFSTVPFERGAVAMGRDPGGDNGGSCQFFVVLQRTPEWDGQYNLFGRVVEGIEAAEEISRAPLTTDPHPALRNRPAGRQILRQVRIEYRE